MSVDVSVRGGRIVALVPSLAVEGLGPVFELPPGAVVTGGFVDHHLHVLALMASRGSIDLSSAGSLAEVFDLLRAGLAGPDGAPEPGGWARAWGIDESALAERRLPSRAELDAVAGGRPLVVHHRTGHVRLLNRAAQRAGGVAPPLPFAQLRALAVAVGADLAAAGVVAVTDATHTNDLAALDLLDRLALPQRLTAMIGLAGQAELDGRAGPDG